MSASAHEAQEAHRGAGRAAMSRSRRWPVPAGAGDGDGEVGAERRQQGGGRDQHVEALTGHQPAHARRPAGRRPGRPAAARASALLARR